MSSLNLKISFRLEIHEEPDRDLNPRRSYLPMVFAVAALVGVLVGYAFWIKSKPHTTDRQRTRTNAVPAAAATTPVKVSAPTPVKASTPVALLLQRQQQWQRAAATPPAKRRNQRRKSTCGEAG